jgi:hypothetical protein
MANAPRTATTAQLRNLLNEAAETHHQVFRIVDGLDPDWASWYADWLLNLSELPLILGTRPVRSELVYLLVGLDKEYTSQPRDAAWEEYYAGRILETFKPKGAPYSFGG